VRRRGIWIVAGAVVLVAAAGAVWWLAVRTPSAEDAARTYLQALERGDLQTIQTMRDPLDADAERVVEDSFRGATAYLTDPRITGTREEEDGTVSIGASAVVDGERRELRFHLREADGRWVLTGDHLASVTVNATVEGGGTPLTRVRVGTALVPTATPAALLPAVYPVTAIPEAVLTGAETVTVVGGDAVTVELSAAFSPDATAAAQEQLDAYATACAEPAAIVPTHCGLVVPWPADLVRLDRVAFRVEKLPTVTLITDTMSFAATGGVIVATASGVAHDGTQASFTYRTDQWALQGSVGFDTEAMVLSVR
jgi:hypothetical protein